MIEHPEGFALWYEGSASILGDSVGAKIRFFATTLKGWARLPLDAKLRYQCKAKALTHDNVFRDVDIEVVKAQMEMDGRGSPSEGSMVFSDASSDSSVVGSGEVEDAADVGGSVAVSADLQVTGSIITSDSEDRSPVQFPIPVRRVMPSLARVSAATHATVIPMRSPSASITARRSSFARLSTTPRTTSVPIQLTPPSRVPAAARNTSIPMHPPSPSKLPVYTRTRSIPMQPLSASHIRRLPVTRRPATTRTISIPMQPPPPSRLPATSRNASISMHPPLASRLPATTRTTSTPMQPPSSSTSPATNRVTHPSNSTADLFRRIDEALNGTYLRAARSQSHHAAIPTSLDARYPTPQSTHYGTDEDIAEESDVEPEVEECINKMCKRYGISDSYSDFMSDSDLDFDKFNEGYEGPQVAGAGGRGAFGGARL
ncbi:hypothetical protein EUX98_g6728 [Antrodiella citrinella]|uniref:Uncharacterized protein n=1 Tax=Antrodiella citrinella TaxID=2447956 RepID=A0A4S4MQA6_9APHY|nr:hypothetical protein EUX98_g6728 [Antrodiella citrinella]